MLCDIDSSQHLPANGCQGSHAHQSSQLILHRHAAMEAVVMETGESAAAADGTVTMEIAAAAPAERADTEVQRSGAAFPDRNYRMLIVIGELCNSHHLDAVRNQIAQGKTSGRALMTRHSTFSGIFFHHRIFSSTLVLECLNQKLSNCVLCWRFMFLYVSFTYISTHFSNTITVILIWRFMNLTLWFFQSNLLMQSLNSSLSQHSSIA